MEAVVSGWAQPLPAKGATSRVLRVSSGRLGYCPSPASGALRAVSETK